MYVPQQISDTVPFEYVSLVAELERGHLALYVGAGVSMADPTGLPSGAQAATSLMSLVAGRLNVGTPAPATLEALADRLEENGNLPALKSLAPRAAHFSTAPPNYAHKAIALLLAEGATPVFSANWDMCIEKGGVELGIPLTPSVTDEDRVHRFRNSVFHKVHGCITVTDSLLVSSAELGTPPTWVTNEVQAAIGNHTVVFLGLGTVGGYVRTRVQQVLDVLGDARRVRVATPGSPSRDWIEILGDEQAAESHIACEADEFLDRLLRALCQSIVANTRQAAAGLVSDGSWQDDCLVGGLELAADAIDNVGALSFLNWVRRGSGGVEPPRRLLTGDLVRDLLLAMSAHSAGKTVQAHDFGDDLAVEISDGFLEPAIWPERSAADVVRIEEARIDEKVRRAHIDPEKPVHHLVVGHRGRLPSADLEGDLVAESPVDDLIAPHAQHVWVSVSEALQRGRCA